MSRRRRRERRRRRWEEERAATGRYLLGMTTVVFGVAGFFVSLARKMLGTAGLEWSMAPLLWGLGLALLGYGAFVLWGIFARDRPWRVVPVVVGLLVVCVATGALLTGSPMQPEVYETLKRSQDNPLSIDLPEVPPGPYSGLELEPERPFLAIDPDAWILAESADGAGGAVERDGRWEHSSLIAPEPDALEARARSIREARQREAALLNADWPTDRATVSIDRCATFGSVRPALSAMQKAGFRRVDIVVEGQNHGLVKPVELSVVDDDMRTVRIGSAGIDATFRGALRPPIPGCDAGGPTACARESKDACAMVVDYEALREVVQGALPYEVVVHVDDGATWQTVVSTLDAFPQADMVLWVGEPSD